MDWNPVTWYSDSKQFATEVRAEYRKVTWPSQKEYMGGTLGVLVVVTVVTVVLGVVDFALSQMLRLVMG